jgi:transposase
LEGAVYVFRNRAGTALKLLLYDGQGYWMMLKRLSQGRFRWWPTSADARVPLSARELIIVLWNGNPERAQGIRVRRDTLRSQLLRAMI